MNESTGANTDLGTERAVLELKLGDALRWPAIAAGGVFLLALALAMTVGVYLPMLGWGAVAATVTFALFGIGPLRHVGTRVVMYWDAVAVERGGVRRVIHLDDVREAWLDLEQVGKSWVPLAFIHGVGLVDGSGARLDVPMFGNRERAGQVVNHISRRVVGRFLEESRTALREDREVSFGDVIVSRAGIRVRGAFAEWQELRLVLFQASRFSLFRRLPIIPWKLIRLDRVPNAMALVQLVRERAPRSEIDDPLGLLRAP